MEVLVGQASKNGGFSWIFMEFPLPGLMTPEGTLWLAPVVESGGKTIPAST
jgi:hypothetical protein